MCGSKNLDLVLGLTPTPLANEFLLEPVEQPVYPLDLMLCGSCGHVQLGVVVDPEVLYPNYLYSTATFSEPKPWHPVVQAFEAYAKQMAARFAPKMVVDVGCNDGTLLRAFKAEGCEVLGVDPARKIVGEVMDVPIITGFFTSALAKDIASKFGQADLITANNVLAHVDDLDDVVLGVKALLAPQGVFSMQVSYLHDVVERGYFDTIYHEHLDYHTVTPLVEFFEKHDLQVFDVQHVDFYGGSIRLLVRSERGGAEPSVKEVISFEAVHGMAEPGTYELLGKRIGWCRDRLLSRLKGPTVGFGAPAKLTTLMYHFGMDGIDIPFVVDDTPAKQGRHTPGLHIPIVPVDELGKPEAVLVFAWNCAAAIMEQHPGHSYLVPSLGL